MTLYITAAAGVIIAGLIIHAVREMGSAPTAEELKSFEKLPYFKNGQFRNPQPLPAPMTGEYEDKVNLLNLIFPNPTAPENPLP